MKNRFFIVTLCVLLVFSLSTLFCGVFAAQDADDGKEAAEETTAEEAEESDKSEENKFKMDFHPEGFVKQLGKMGVGMLGIFIIIGIIIIATVIINKVFSSRPGKEN